MSHYIEVSSGVKIYVEDQGRGKPVVFLHGWSLSHKIFIYQFKHLLTHHYRCIGLDLRGFGLSDRPVGQYTYDLFADDIKHVLDTLDLHQVILCGFSMGGAIAIRYMAKHAGHRIKKLVLLAAAAPIFTKNENSPHGFSKAEINRIIDHCYQDKAKMLENFGALFFTTSNALTSQWRNTLHNLGMQASTQAMAMSAMQLCDQDLRVDLKSIQVPTAILHGVADKVCPFAFTKEIQKGIKNSWVIRFEKSGHGLFWEEAKKLNTVLLQFAD